MPHFGERAHLMFYSNHGRKVCIKKVVFWVSSSLPWVYTTFGSILQAETLQEAVKFTIDTNPDVRAGVYNRLARDQEVKRPFPDTIRHLK